MKDLFRSLVLLVFFLSASIPLFAQSIPLPGFEEERIIGVDEGKLASLEEEGWTSQGRLYFRHVSFDPEGRPLEERFTNGDDSPGSWILYEYDSRGRLTKKIFHHPDARVPDTEVYTWEGERLFSVARIFTTGKYGWRYEYSYDQAGRLVTATKIDRYWKDVVVWTKIFTYDEAGRIKEVIGGGLDENIQWREEFDYVGEEKQPREKRRWDAGEELSSRTLYTYGDEGVLLSVKEITTRGSVWGEIEFRYRFDERGNWTEKLVGTPVLTQGRDYLNPASWYVRRYTYRD